MATSVSRPASGLIPLKITVTSDSICPFCYLGLVKLQKGLELSPTTSSNDAKVFDTSIEFLPFQLDPTLPKDKALNKREMYAKKFGPERMQGMEEMMKQRGKEVGINFSYGGTVRSTFLSHRLMAKAFQVGGWQTQLTFLNKIFPHYFEQEGDPGDAVELSKLAVESGIFTSQADADAFVKSDELSQEVEKGFQQARAKGITGVPHFELQASKPDSPPLVAEIPGAQDSETIAAILGQMATRLQAAA